jgi:hypothetical protein
MNHLTKRFVAIMALASYEKVYSEYIAWIDIQQVGSIVNVYIKLLDYEPLTVQNF